MKNTINELTADAKSVRYRVRDNKFLDLLMYDGDKPYMKVFQVSIPNGLFILNNGAFSLKDTFTIGPIIDKTTNHTYSDL